MKDHDRRFTRPLLLRITDRSAAFTAILADQAEHDPALADHLLNALADLERACPDPDAEATPQPIK